MEIGRGHESEGGDCDGQGPSRDLKLETMSPSPLQTWSPRFLKSANLCKCLFSE